MACSGQAGRGDVARSGACHRVIHGQRSVKRRNEKGERGVLSSLGRYLGPGEAGVYCTTSEGVLAEGTWQAQQQTVYSKARRGAWARCNDGCLGMAGTSARAGGKWVRWRAEERSETRVSAHREQAKRGAIARVSRRVEQDF